MVMEISGKFLGNFPILQHKYSRYFIFQSPSLFPTGYFVHKWHIQYKCNLWVRTLLLDSVYPIIAIKIITNYPISNKYILQMKFGCKIDANVSQMYNNTTTVQTGLF